MTHGEPLRGRDCPACGATLVLARAGLAACRACGATPRLPLEGWTPPLRAHVAPQPLSASATRAGAPGSSAAP